MKAIILTISLLFALNLSGQTDTLTKEIKVGNKTYEIITTSHGRKIISNKAGLALFDSLYRGTTYKIPEDRMLKAIRTARIINKDQELHQTLQSIYTPEEIIDLEKNGLSLALVIDNEGRVASFSYFANSTGLDFEKLSQLEDKILSTLRFKMTDPGVPWIRQIVSLRMSNPRNDGHVFLKGLYLNP